MLPDQSVRPAPFRAKLRYGNLLRRTVEIDISTALAMMSDFERRYTLNHLPPSREFETPAMMRTPLRAIGVESPSEARIRLDREELAAFWANHPHQRPEADLLT